MTKPFEWKFDARELMTGSHIIPKPAKIFRRRYWAKAAMQKAQE